MVPLAKSFDQYQTIRLTAALPQNSDGKLFKGELEHVFQPMLEKYDVVVVEAKNGWVPGNSHGHPFTASLKIRPDFGIFFVADPVHLFQVVSASERPHCDNSRRHHWADTRYQSQLFFRRGVDVELGGEQSLALDVARSGRGW